MSWLDSLDIEIQEALRHFPQPVSVASLKIGDQQWLVSRQSLEEMIQMNLGHLPLSTMVLPYEAAEMLTRNHEELHVRDISAHFSDYFSGFFVAAIYELQSLFNTEQIQASMIGGLVRDMLLSEKRRFEMVDVDILIEGNAVGAAETIAAHSSNFRLLETFPEFGTAKLEYKGEIEFDLASTRREIYPQCGHLPQVVAMGVPLSDDVVRRDFTINSLALSITKIGQVQDYTGGLKDLASRKIRLLKPSSFFEDPSRILRALGFATRLDFEWSADTRFLLESFKRWMPQIYKGGGDRIRAELFRFLHLPESPAKYRWLSFFVEQGLIRLLDTQLPEALDLPVPLDTMVKRVTELSQQLADYWSDTLSWEVYITLLFLGLPDKYREQAAHRLGLTRHELEVIEKSSQLLDENRVVALTEKSRPCELYEVFHPLPLASSVVGLVLSCEWEYGLQAFLRYKKELESVKLEITGDDIMHLGVPQGRQVGELLKSLLRAKLEGQVLHRLDELNWVKNQLAEVHQEA